ncbi:MAG: metal ABC transporter substrate-binding protein [Solirubrobacterales bacterium]
MVKQVNPLASVTKRARIAALAIALCALPVLISACSAADDSGSDSGKPVVLTTFTVIADMVSNVAGDRVEVSSITKPGAEIHGYEPTPSDLKTAASADLIIENGLGLERWFEQFVEQSSADFVALSDGVEPIAITGDSEYAGLPNPHAWMSVSNAKIYIENIRKALTDLDPSSARYFQKNADEYSAKLSKVSDFVKADLANLPASQRALVSCEGAFSYMAKDFGLEEAYLWPVNAEQEGTPQQIAETIEFVRDNEVPSVFCESTVSDKSQQQVASESGAEFGGVLYVDSLSEADGPVPTYEELLRRDAETIVAGLSGGTE